MKIVTVIGARPQFIKACMLSKSFNQDPSIQEILVHTGQHYDSNMSDIFFQQLKMSKPNYNLNVGSGTHAEQTGSMLIKLESIYIKEKPDAVLVYGDTNSTLAASIAASKLHIPIIHVESGLRSFNRNMPEEINRIVTDHLSTLLFCPSQEAADQLNNESIQNGVHVTGDIMYDAVLHYRVEAINYSTLLERNQLSSGQYYAATIHRAENTDHPTRLTSIIKAFSQLDLPVIMPLHPRTKKMLADLHLLNLGKKSNLQFISPVDYFDMLSLMSQAKAILTDSGGVQKEAYMLKVPCITLRDETEWTDTVRAKWNQLVSANNSSAIIKTVSKAEKPTNHPALFGDGHSALNMHNLIKQTFLK